MSQEKPRPLRTEDEARDALRKAYEIRYNGNDYPFDSTERSRMQCMQEMMIALRSKAVEPQRILNIGSGAQKLEDEFIKTYTNPTDKLLVERTEIVTLDIAWIDKRLLRASVQENVRHVQGDASKLPFEDGSFGMTVSNVAIDLAPEGALAEAARVLSPGGIFVFNFNHPDVVREVYKEGRRGLDFQIAAGYLIENDALYSSLAEIREDLIKHRLLVTKGQLCTSGNPEPGKWWFVKGRKLMEGEETPEVNPDLTFSEK